MLQYFCHVHRLYSFLYLGKDAFFLLDARQDKLPLEGFFLLLIEELGVLDRADSEIRVAHHSLQFMFEPLLALQPFRDLLSPYLQSLVLLLVATHRLFLLAFPSYLFELNGALLDGLQGFSIQAHEFADHAFVEVNVHCFLLHGFVLAWTCLFLVLDAFPAIHGLKTVQDLKVE